MALIFTPGRMSKLAEWYQQLEQLLTAGIGLIEALRSQQRGIFREPIPVLLSELNQGSTFAEALDRAGHWFPEFDIALLKAGEQSGRLPSCFGLLAGYYRERAQLLRQVLSNLAYPVFLLHFAIFIIPFPAFFQGGSATGYLLSTFGILAPLYLVIFLGVFASQARHGEWWRSVVESVTGMIPVLGSARRELALARLATALEALLAAGVPIIRAWPLAAAASGSPAIRRRVATWKTPLETGSTPSDMVGGTRVFPDLFADLYRTGELSGQLDDALKRIGQYYRSEGERRMQVFAQWVPRLIYMGVVLVIAWHVISFWLSYFGRLSEILP